MFYDPMIAKLVTHAPDRLQAIDAMQAALDAYGIRGINHNIAFLSSVMTNPRFRAGDLSTSFIAEVFPDGFQGMEVTEETREILIAVAAILQQRRAIRASRSEEHTSELQSLMRTSYAVFCLKKK